MLENLDVASWLCVLERLSKEIVPIGDTAKKFSNVNEVKVVRGISPLWVGLARGPGEF